MRWTLIQKIPNPELEGNYRNPAVKEHLRQEGEFRCVYCAIHESKLGGVRIFHVEHYRPKSRDEFKHLEHVLSNLFYVCPICNSFKSDTWPAEPTPTFDNASYPDPSVTDYSVLFEVRADGEVEGLNPASRYIVSQLYFNRPQLILERRQFALNEELENLNQNQSGLMDALKNRGDAQSVIYITQLAEINQQLTGLLLELQSLPLYEPNDVRRQR